MYNHSFLRNKLSEFLESNPSKKKVIIINSYDKIAVLAGIFKSMKGSLGENIAILCFKSKVPELFNGFSGRVKLSEDYLSDDDYLKIDEHAYKTAKNWDEELLKKYTDIFSYRGIELARIGEFNFHNFIITKVKALVVIGRAIEKEGYGAALIIDSNGDLTRFDKLLSRHYGIRCGLVRIDTKESFRAAVKRRVFSAISDLLDVFAALLLRKKKQAKLIDAKLFYQLEISDGQGFVLVPFEKGLNLRLKCIFKNGGYAVFGVASGRRPLFRQGEAAFLESSAEKFTFEGISYWESIKDEAEALVYSGFARFRNTLDCLERMSRNCTIESIILRNDIKEAEKAVVLGARQLRIPTLVIQHGVMQSPNCNSIIFADKMAVWGRRAAQWYKSFGNNPDKIVIVGNPGFDRLAGYRNSESKNDLIKKLGLAEKKYLITLFSPGGGMVKLSSFKTDDASEAVLLPVIRAVRSLGNANLIVKLHPNEKVEDFAGLFRSKDRHFLAVVEQVDLHALIDASDIIVSTTSTVALDAIIMNKPLVVINLTKRPDLIPYADRNAAIGVCRAEDIESSIRDALEDESARGGMNSAREEIIDFFAYRIDGRARERILSLVKNLLI